MVIIDRSIVRGLLATRADTLAGFTIRHAGEGHEDDQDMVVATIEGFDLQHAPRAVDTDPDIAEIEARVRIEIGTNKVNANIYALDSAMSQAVKHFLIAGALEGTDHQVEWSACREEDLGELEGPFIRAGRIHLFGQVTRITGDTIADHL